VHRRADYLEWRVGADEDDSGVGALTIAAGCVRGTVEVEILRASLSDTLRMTNLSYFQEGNSLLPRIASAAQAPR
jgi:hypothetical protein